MSRFYGSLYMKTMKHICPHDA